jgi:ABC-2 type transport system ATP-binding protein
VNVIVTDKLTKSYGKARGIVDVTLDVQQGEIFGFIGPNGAGKSTTIRTLLAFMFPDSGSARIFDKDCFTQSDEIKKEIGYLPSEVNYYDDMKVGELLSYSSRFYKKDCSKRIKELVDIFDLDTSKRIDSLSFGNKKKTAIVQALLHEPKLLILDEPTGGLDPLMQNRFFDVLKQENEKGTTIFFSSHILSEVQRMCSRVAIIKEGRILKVEQVDVLRSGKYKKIRIESADKNIEEIRNLKGVSKVEEKDEAIEVLYSRDMDSIIRWLSQRHVENLWIEEPTLEEVFMHFYEKEER